MAHSLTLALPGDSLEGFTIPQVAALLGVAPAAVRGWIKNGELLSIELGSRRRVLRKDLEQFLDGNRAMGFRQLRPNQYAGPNRSQGIEDDWAGFDGEGFNNPPGR